MRAAVESRTSAVLTGDSGVGKTCVLRGLEASLNPARFQQIQAHMEELADQQKIHPVLLLNEAQLVPLSMLEQLHILLNG